MNEVNEHGLSGLFDSPRVTPTNGEAKGGTAPVGSEITAAESAEEPGEGVSADSKHRKSQATQLVELALSQNLEFFHSPDGVPYVSMPEDDHRETSTTKAKSFRDYMARLYYVAVGSAPGAQAIRDAIMTLDGKARYEGRQEDVHVRVAEAGGKLYLDLGDPGWTAVEISTAGWRVLKNPPVRFRRPAGMAPLPIPVKGGKVGELRRFLNIREDDDDFVLVCAWVVAALRARGPYPILYIVGEQGSAKSTTTKLIRRLIDPYKAELRTAPREERDLQIAANNSHVIALDNVSRMDSWLSDAMCRLATGGGLATRELYSDADEIIFDAQRPQLVNGIEELATRGDFMERSIVVTLPAIADSARQDEKQFWAGFDKAQPGILGAFLDGMSAALRDANGIKPERLPRMADFYLWGVAAQQAMGFPAGTFERAYDKNRSLAHEVVIEASAIAQHLLTLVEKDAADGWTGTTKELLTWLNATAGEAEQKSKAWPHSTQALGAQLRRLAPTLRTVGINYLAPDRRTKGRTLQLVGVPERSAPKEPKAPVGAGAGFGGADVGADVGAERQQVGQRHHDRHHVSHSEQKNGAVSAVGAVLSPTPTHELTQQAAAGVVPGEIVSVGTTTSESNAGPGSPLASLLGEGEI